MAVELSDVGLLELLSYKLACAETSILEVPFALEYSPELIPYWIEYAPYYYCYTDKTQFSTGNRYVAKDYDGRWKKIETDIIIRDEFNKLLGLKELNIHYRNQRKTGWIMWVYSYSHMPSTQNQSNSPSPSPSIGLVLLKIHFQPDLRDPDLEELTVAAEDMVIVLDRPVAKRRKFT